MHDSFSAAEQALVLYLLEGHSNAVRDRCDPWQFAVNLHDLQLRGLSAPALHALLRAGLVLHGIERLDPDAADRSIQPVLHRHLSSVSCFILSEEGVHRACALLAQRDAAVTADQLGPSAAALLPSFARNADGSRTLSCLGQVVRVFRRFAPVEEKILETFEARHWPLWIADPLPRLDRGNPKIRLKQAITRLNDKQDPLLLRFHGDGNGQGVRWEPQ
jgi:hypothetical protein